MTTGTVTMSIADLDKLRDAIKEKEQQIKTLEKEKEEIKAEKRVLCIKEKTYVNNSNEAKIIEDLIYKSSRLGYNEVTQFIHNHHTYSPSFDVYNRNHVIEKTEEYLNFEDVKESLKKDVEQQVFMELGELRVFKQNALKLEQTLKAKLEQEKEDLMHSHKQVVNNLNKQLEDLVKQYEDLKNDKLRISREKELQKQVEELKQELIKEKSKKWYQKLFK